MKIVVLLLSLLGLTFSLPVKPLGRRLATSNSREILQLMQRYRAMGNIPQRTEQKPNPGVGLPPAKLVPDQTPLANQLPNEVTPLEWPFANFPVLSPQFPSELGTPNVQNVPAFNLPLTQMFPIDINYLAALLGALYSTQMLPVAGGGMTVPQQLLPPQSMLPVLFAQMSPQGAVLSSEEMTPSQVFAGVLVPGMQAGFFPSGQSEALPEGQEGPLPAGQAESNQGNLPFPEGTAAGIQKVVPTMSNGMNEAASDSYHTPSGFRQPGLVTVGVVAEPTASVNMEPSELREPPTSLLNLEKAITKKQRNPSPSLVRGDSHAPINPVEVKPLKAP
ncbi:amelotin [Varanus komodoensis]|uniref:amelotin n=1 Tax=Varanus komodoensis TaxID=61221 RepID=UPI001CF772D7|nr:amelotin [Varanus komodoensis]